MMDVVAIQNFIGSIGFPAFVAIWMLYKTSKDSEKMSDAVNELKNAITELSTLIKNDGDNNNE